MKLYVIGFGPGKKGGMTYEAGAAIEDSSWVVGYTVYTDIIKQYYPEKNYLETGMTKEKDRVEMALNKAREETVSLVCSGDSGVYGMACLALEMGVDYPDVEIEVVPGITAALSGGAVLGAPLTHDFCVISLSDLLTPWEKIESRLEAAGMGDFCVAIYNPSSKKRGDYLMKACDILMEHKNPETVCGYVRNIRRPGEERVILSLGELRDTKVDMFTTVFIGNSETKEIGGRMVTPRGYKVS